MGCELNPKIVYTEFSAVVRRQKEILKKLIERKQAQIRKVHPGLTCFKDGVREIPIESIPGIIEAGWVPPADRGSERKTRTDTSDPDVLYNALKTILNATKSNQYAWPFQTPVDRKMVSMIYYVINCRFPTTETNSKALYISWFSPPHQKLFLVTVQIFVKSADFCLQLCFSER